LETPLVIVINLVSENPGAEIVDAKEIRRTLKMLFFRKKSRIKLAAK